MLEEDEGSKVPTAPQDPQEIEATLETEDLKDQEGRKGHQDQKDHQDRWENQPDSLMKLQEAVYKGLILSWAGSHMEYAGVAFYIN